jgi:hypothetical protein
LAGSLHPARPAVTPAGVPSQRGVVGLVGVFCKALVTRAFGDGVTMPPGAPDLGGGPGPTVAYLDTLFGPDYWIYRQQLIALGTRKDVLSGVGCQQVWHPKIAD